MHDAARVPTALRAVLVSLTCLLLAGEATPPAVAATPPPSPSPGLQAPLPGIPGAGAGARAFVFLSRDAVVRQSDQAFPLIDAGVKAPACIVCYPAPPNTPNRETYNSRADAAARQLREYLGQVTGASVNLVDADAKVPAGTAHVIFLGDKEADWRKDAPEPDKVDGHGFLLRTETSRGKDTRDLRIVSPSGDGLVYAVNFFLMNYAGVRFIGPNPTIDKTMRSDLGVEVPHQRKIELPLDLFILNPGPDYQLRIWTGNDGFECTNWLCDYTGDRGTRGSQRYEYHHNMYHIFDPALYDDKDKHPESYHPEYYPILGGKQVLPKPTDNHAWQPTFSSPTTAQVTNAYADKLFTTQPDMRSISLTPNDGGGYSDADVVKGHAVAGNGGYSIADVYRTYVNTVAKHLEEKWPGRYAAFLPYGYMQEPPEGKFEDNVMVFLFLEPKVRYAMWKDKAKAFGIYLWLYGTRYPFPNQWPHAMQELLRWGHGVGVKAFKAEAYNGWAEGGPRMWVLCNLLWNADADVDALLKDYYEHAYGPAAPMIGDFYAQAEKVYERRHKGDLYNFSPSDVPGIAAVKDVEAQDLEVMDAKLTEASQTLEKALDTAIRARDFDTRDHVLRARERLRFLRDGFDWGAAYCRANLALEGIEKLKIDSNAAIDQVFELTRQFHEQTELAPHIFTDRIVRGYPYSAFQDGGYKESEPFIRWENYAPDMMTCFSNITGFLKRTTPDRDLAVFWHGVGEASPDNAPFAEHQRMLLLDPGREPQNLFPDDGFEDLTDATLNQKGSPNLWGVYHNRMIDATVSLDRQVFHSGKQSIRVQGVTDESGLIIWHKIEPHRLYRFSFWYKTENTTTNVAFQFGTSYPPRVRDSLPESREWTKVERLFTLVPEDAGRTTMTWIMGLRKGGSQDMKVWLDDIRLEMLAPEGVAEESPRPVRKN